MNYVDFIQRANIEFEIFNFNIISARLEKVVKIPSGFEIFGDIELENGQVVEDHFVLDNDLIQHKWYIENVEKLK